MKYSKSVRNWLFIGVIMLFIQVVLGGITRITGSGLSITKWDIIIGALPPTTAIEWSHVFDLYKETPQYQKINGGMSLKDFKFIFFWEYIHRLWARIMGFVFIFPFIFFLIKNEFNTNLIWRLFIVFILSAFTAAFGWIMVASGLLERPWVNPYKLGFHLILAFITYVYLLWTFFIVGFKRYLIPISKNLYYFYNLFIGLLWFQIFLGGIVSGMKAGLYYNTWPLMGGNYTPMVLKQINQWTFENMTLYDINLFAPSLIQFVHRNIAYVLIIVALWIIYKLQKLEDYPFAQRLKYIFVSTILVQVGLGISIVLLTNGKIPLLYGVLHQMIAFILLGVSYFMLYLFRKV